MSNIIAVIWDFDKTLVDGYMQDPIFKKYGVDSKQFWEEVNTLQNKYWDEQKVKVNKDTIYLNHFINKTKEGVFKGLNNDLLFELGKELKFYKKDWNGVKEDEYYMELSDFKKLTSKNYLTKKMLDEICKRNFVLTPTIIHLSENEGKDIDDSIKNL